MKFTGMSRTIRCLIAMMAVCLVMLCGVAVAESTSDFTISDGVLTKYNGSDQIVTVPDGVTSIGADAFSNSHILSKVTLPDTVTSIGDSAFGNCYSLPSIILPDGITSIGQDVFYDRITVYCNENTTTEQTLSEAGYSYQIYQPIAVTYADNGDGTATITGLTGVGDELIIPSTVDGLKVTTIGKSAFRYNTELTSVVIPEGVTKIESGAFNGCRLIQSMTLPSTLVTIESSAFTNCYQITELTIPAATTDIYAGAFRGSPIPLVIDGANTAYTVVDGVLYTADRKILKFCPDSKTGVFAIPEGTEEVESGAFFACNSVTELHIPASVTTIPAYSFYPMGALNDFVVDEASESYQAVDGMLLTKDGKILIVGCDAQNGKVTIPDGVEEIWPQALVSSRITELVLPEGVITINTRAIDAYRLEKVNLPGSLTSIDSNAFSSKRSTLVATVEDGSYAHQWCIDNDVTVEVLSPFTYTDNGDGTCTITGYNGSAVHVDVPDELDGLKVTTIGEFGFDMAQISSITLPEGLERIEELAFCFCENLTSIHLPASVNYVDSRAFSPYSAITQITVEEANQTYTDVDGVLFTKDMNTLVRYPAARTDTSYTMPDGVTTLGRTSMHLSYSLEEIILPETIETIDVCAMSYCVSLRTINLPEGISYISEWALDNVGNVTAMVKGGSYAHQWCVDNDVAYNAIYPFTYNDNGDGTATITGYTGTSAAVTIPASINGLNVTAIGDSAFENNTTITNVIIPEGVTSIGQYAFWQCRSLQSVSLPETLTTIEDYAFSFCSNLTELRIPAAATSIGSAFYGMPTIITVDSANTAYKTVDDVLYTIDGKTLKFCPNSKQGVFTIPEGTEKLDFDALFGCGELTEISIPASVTTIPGDAFGEANKLTGFVVDENNTAYKAVNGMLLSKNGTLLHTVPMTFSGTVTVPEGVTTIGNCAFRGSWPAGVTEIVLPDSVAVLEHEAFLNQTALEKINLPASLTSISDGAFYNLNSECVATVYENTLAHRWCVEKGIKVNVLESDGLIFPVAASRLCTNPETPAGCYFASVQKANGELRMQFDNDACLWDDLVTSAVYEDGTMMLPVDVLRLSGAAAYRWMEGDPESETILDQLAQASAQTLGEYDEQIYLSIPYAQYDEANQTVSPVASENTFLIQWLDGNGEIMLTESVTMIITHSDLSSRSAQIRYFDMSTAIPNYHNVEGVTSRVENNTLIYSVPADYEELISTRYPAIEGAAFARPTCFGWTARLPLSDGNTYWSWRMSGVELPFVDESAILWFDENDHYLGCERISVRYEVKAEEQLIPSMPASRIFPDDIPFGMEATVTVADGKFGVHIDDEATNWNDVFTFLEGMPWHNPDTGESGVWSDEVMIGARMTDLDGAVYSKSVVGNVWENDEEIMASLESSDDVQDLTTYGHGWWHDVVVLDRDSGSISLSEIVRDPDFGGDYTYAVQWFDADMNVIATEKVVYEITHTNPDKTYNYSRTLIPAENIVANVENASGVTSTVKDGSVSYKQIAEDAVIVTEIIAPENAVTYSAPGEYFDSDAERWPVDNGKIGYVREGVLMDTVTASDFICWYDADGELIGGGWIDFCYERGEEAEILPMAAERIAVQGGAFGLEVDVEITDGMMHAVFDDEATNWNDVFTFLEPTPWYNPETSEKGVRFGAYFYIPEGAAYAKHIVVETEDTDEEILAYLAEETELATLNANMRFGSYYFPAELNNGVITLNDYHTNVQVFQWLDEDQNVLFTEKAVLCFEHTNPNQTYNYSRTLIPAQNIVGNAENMPGVTWKAADGLIVTTVEDKQITTTTEIIAPENAATYSMPELDTNGERWELYNGRVGFQRVGWPSTENQKSTEYLLCWYDADGDLIGGGWITMTDVCPIPETVLPAFTKEIAEEAFAGSGVQRVIIPDGCTTIGARAFANCASLTEVHIPASVTSIAEDAFVGCPNLMIYASMPSTGADFASDHDIAWFNVSNAN